MAAGRHIEKYMKFCKMATSKKNNNCFSANMDWNAKWIIDNSIIMKHKTTEQNGRRYRWKDIENAFSSELRIIDACVRQFWSILMGSSMRDKFSFKNCSKDLHNMATGHHIEKSKKKHACDDIMAAAAILEHTIWLKKVVDNIYKH